MNVFLFVALTFLSSGMNLVESVMIKKYNEKHAKGGFFFTGIVSLFSMLFFVGKEILVNGDGFDFTLEMLPYGIAAGIFYCTASILTFIALCCGPFALSRLILSYGGIFSICYGIFFLHDKVGVFTVIGILLMLVSLYLTRVPKGDNERKATIKWLVSIVLSAVGSGMFGVLVKMQQVKFLNAVDNEFMIVTLGFSALALFIAGIIKDGKDTLYILKNGTSYSAVAGLSNGLSNFLTLFTNQLLLISIASPVRSGVGIIFSFIVSLLFFKEKFLPRQVVGMIVGTASIVLINL